MNEAQSNEGYGKFKPRRYNDINSPQNPETFARDSGQRVRPRKPWSGRPPTSYEVGPFRTF